MNWGEKKIHPPKSPPKNPKKASFQELSFCFPLVPSSLETGQTNSGKSNGKGHCVSYPLACY